MCLSQVGFQAGCSSLRHTNILRMSNVQRDDAGNALVRAARSIWIAVKTSILWMFLIGWALIIQVVPNNDSCAVKLSSASIV
jgi:hypothetical protein